MDSILRPRQLYVVYEDFEPTLTTDERRVWAALSTGISVCKVTGLEKVTEISLAIEEEERRHYVRTQERK